MYCSIFKDLFRPSPDSLIIISLSAHFVKRFFQKKLIFLIFFTSLFPKAIPEGLEAPPGFEPGVKALQAHALPLGYSAISAGYVPFRVISARKFRWSGLRGSNSLPPPWQGGALPDELNPHIMVLPVGIEPTTRGFSVLCSTD